MDATDAPDIQTLESSLKERHTYLTAKIQATHPGRERSAAQIDALLQMLTEQAHRIALLERRFVGQLVDPGSTTEIVQGELSES